MDTALTGLLQIDKIKKKLLFCICSIFIILSRVSYQPEKIFVQRLIQTQQSDEVEDKPRLCDHDHGCRKNGALTLSLRCRISLKNIFL